MRIKEYLSGPVKLIELDGMHLLSYCADSGADVSDTKVTPACLANAVPVKTTGGHFPRATSNVNLTLQINTAAGPVRLATPVPCLFIEEDEDEFIVGKDGLGMLGIDVERQLEQ
ncbi:hypothetical protein PHMEG_00018188 [Phytophthora megakarya]|uniref:Uncharacterized protein n=1 Tax=Phytophthora megakarya TaxID=4795 RepID=A0A225VUX9_9STRA|nr:hypothetical protein PHMEG_00018188 [Phytophthora megakarya]